MRTIGRIFIIMALSVAVAAGLYFLGRQSVLTRSLPVRPPTERSAPDDDASLIWEESRLRRLETGELSRFGGGRTLELEREHRGGSWAAAIGFAPILLRIGLVIATVNLPLALLRRMRRRRLLGPA
ncbi:MAG: hypothetical protein Kow0047_33250 [Anaerolineae bacterium]